VHVVKSTTGVSIRLPDERWAHSVEHHDDLAGYRDRVLEAIEHPDGIARGKSGELMAFISVDRRTLVVVYRETSASDGFVITAFFTTQPDRIRKRGVVWAKQ
jgi:hypothetical protein